MSIVSGRPERYGLLPGRSPATSATCHSRGRGAIGTWRIQLPTQFKAFDYDTIADVVLHVRYTRAMAASCSVHATAEMSVALEQLANGGQGLVARSVRVTQFPTEWHRFLNPSSGGNEDQALTLPLTNDRFAFLVQDRITTIDAIELFVKVTPGSDDSHNDDTQVVVEMGPMSHRHRRRYVYRTSCLRAEKHRQARWATGH